MAQLPNGWRYADEEDENPQNAPVSGWRPATEADAREDDDRNWYQRIQARTQGAMYDALRTGSAVLGAVNRTSGDGPLDQIGSAALSGLQSYTDRAANVFRPEGAAPEIAASDGDMLRQGYTYGGSDEIEAALDATLFEAFRGLRGDQFRPGEAFSSTQQRLGEGQDRFRAENPGRAATAEIAGAVASPVNRVLGPLASGARTLGGAAVRGAGVGGGAGAAYEALSENGDIEDRFEAAWRGLLVGAASGGALNPVFHLFGRALQPRRISSADRVVRGSGDELAQSSDDAVSAAYTQAFQGEPRLTPGASNRLAAQARRTLREHSPRAMEVDAASGPAGRVRSLYDDYIADMIDNATSLRDLDTTISELQRAAGRGERAQAARRLARALKQTAREFGDGDVIGPRGRAALDDLFTARELARRNFIVQDIQEILRTTPRDIGQNQAGSIRAALRRLAKKAERMGASPDEIAMINDAANGSVARNLFSLLGHFSPTRLGGMADIPMVGGAAALGSPGIALGAGALIGGGFGAQLSANAMARSSAQQAARRIMAGTAPSAVSGNRAAVPAVSAQIESQRRPNGLIGSRRREVEPRR